MVFSPLLIPIAIILIIKIKEKRAYLKSTYYKHKNIPYGLFKRDAGLYGEYLVYKKLKAYEKKGCKFLFNLYIPKNQYDTTEIDILMITSKGLLVFESKNFGGWIFGTDTRKYWTQCLRSGQYGSQKEKFYNPVMQNKAHIKHLKNLIGNTIPMHSIIVFSNRCTFVDITITEPNVEIIKLCYAPTAVKEFYNQTTTDVLSETDIAELYNQLYPYTQTSPELRKRHNQTIHTKHK